MKRLGIGWLFLMLSLLACGQQPDAVVLTVGGVSVSKAEFLYAYRKNRSQLSVPDFVSRMIETKLWVCLAYEWGLDRSPAFRAAMDTCRLRLQPDECMAVSRAESDTVSERMAHFCIRLPQQASTETIRRAEACMDSLYGQMRADGELSHWMAENGESFCQAWTGELVEPDVYTMLPEVEARWLSLSEGEMSEPFYSPVGLHVIQRCVAGEEVIVPESEGLTADEKELLLQEYHDGLLIGMLMDSLKQTDEEDLKRHYKTHRKQYAWRLPHFKGFVLQATDEASLNEMVCRIAEVDRKRWPLEADRLLAAADTARLKADYGLYQIGSCPSVDQYVFGQGSFVPDSCFSQVRVVGKVLKKKPESYLDVYERVRSDFVCERREREKRKAAREFKVEINEEVLKTVNNRDSI